MFEEMARLEDVTCTCGKHPFLVSVRGRRNPGDPTACFYVTCPPCGRKSDKRDTRNEAIEEFTR